MCIHTSENNGNTTVGLTEIYNDKLKKQIQLYQLINHKSANGWQLKKTGEKCVCVGGGAGYCMYMHVFPHLQSIDKTPVLYRNLNKLTL